jgi:hypothetical protein
MAMLKECKASTCELKRRKDVWILQLPLTGNGRGNSPSCAEQDQRDEKCRRLQIPCRLVSSRASRFEGEMRIHCDRPEGPSSQGQTAITMTRI